MTQLDLFADTPDQLIIDLPIVRREIKKPSAVVISDRLDPHIADQLLVDVQKTRPHVEIRRVFHMSTFSEFIPCLEDRRTWHESLRNVCVNRKRIRLFRHQPTCACCGREANVFVVERIEDRDYINVYSVSDRGTHEMTVDHVVPQCLAGNDSTANRVTMCRLCNESKSSVMAPDEIDKALENLGRSNP